MKVVVVLALLALTALALGETKKKLIGGPDSLPYFLKPDWVKKYGPNPLPLAKKTEEKKKLIGGPDSLPYFLRPEWVAKHGPNPIKKEEAKPEASTFADTAKTQVNKAVNAVKEQGQKVVKTVKEHGQKVANWVKSKVAPAQAQVEQSGFVEDAKNKTVSFWHKIKGFGKKGFEYLKNKLTTKKTEAPVAAPEQSNFWNSSGFHFNKTKNHTQHFFHHLANKTNQFYNYAKNWFFEVPTTTQVKTKVAGAWNKFKGHVANLHQTLKNKLTKKTPEVAAPVETEQAGFAQDAQTKVAGVANQIKGHFKKIHQAIKNKLTKKTPAVAAPVETPAPEQSQWNSQGYHFPIPTFNHTPSFFNRFSNFTQNAYNNVRRYF